MIAFHVIDRPYYNYITSDVYVLIGYGCKNSSPIVNFENYVVIILLNKTKVKTGWLAVIILTTLKPVNLIQLQKVNRQAHDMHCKSGAQF